MLRSWQKKLVLQQMGHPPDALLLDLPNGLHLTRRKLLRSIQQRMQRLLTSSQSNGGAGR